MGKDHQHLGICLADVTLNPTDLIVGGQKQVCCRANHLCGSASPPVPFGGVHNHSPCVPVLPAVASGKEGNFEQSCAKSACLGFVSNIGFPVKEKCANQTKSLRKAFYFPSAKETIYSSSSKHLMYLAINRTM